MGRPKGSKNRNASKFQALFDKYAREYGYNPIKIAFELMGETDDNEQKNPKSIRIQAINAVMPYAYTKKTEQKIEEKQTGFVFGWAEGEEQAIDVKENTNASIQH